MLDLNQSELNKNVRRNKKYKYLEDALVNNTDSPAFIFLKDLMIFAAFLGMKYDKTEPVDKESTSNGITLFTYAGTGKDRSLGQHGLIFLIAMSKYKNMEPLRSENIDDAIKVFESYCNGGLSVLDSWLKDSVNSSIIITKLLQELHGETKLDEPIDMGGF
ncbi:hypothetical protein [Vibrio breoganii]|uniref:hypothetical protein n=1 Tax=Vibrio breoganii TaxID=553239 RepID=UPI000C8262C7|nr:hypothetical protein [Vibrio breoganii]PMH18200.1 hypothetical protein BCU74_09520 [Vibrio breoganii]PMM17597.1 hypothetical protein BCT60_03685 [Vibrio breoganii]